MAGRRASSSKPSRTGQLQIDPAAAHPAFHGDGRTAPYKVLVQTSNIGGMGTDSAMFIRLFWCKGDFTEQLVDSSAQVFEPGKQVTSTFSGPDVGEIQRIQIYSSNGEFRSTCHLSHIDVFSSIMNEVFHFPIDD
ncbi:hypothetical protein DUNSADRAFT_12503 [Dunaliella salina]|nr:hypothetical protein DUNSADRAFT_12503 [Dunaliella salina]KAF5831849.1 hypothetical protein DUNSADRAFT_12503 [Dunaliella salina]|eukprot:KAF5831848.1 hypothetical protein DUNSADRAFT_12503 [Dunaliella salina]